MRRLFALTVRVAHDTASLATGCVEIREQGRGQRHVGFRHLR
jgi:hypothetical protein